MTMLPSSTSTTAPMTAVTSVLMSNTPSIGSLLVNRLTTYPPKERPHQSEQHVPDDAESLIALDE